MLRLVGTTLYAGGSFTSIAGDATHANLAAVDATTGALTTGFDGDPGGTVDALAYVTKLTLGSEMLVAGGSFDHHLVGLDPATGAALAFDPDLDGDVTGIAVLKSGTNAPSIRAVGYRQVWDYLAGAVEYEAMVENGIVATRQLAKRQLTWLRSWPDLCWFYTDAAQQLAGTDSLPPGVPSAIGESLAEAVLKYLDGISI